MRLKIIINLILIVAIAALGVFLVNNGDEPQKKIIPLTSIVPETIRHIDIERTDKGKISFRKIGDNWFMTAPLQARANDNRINAMLQLLRTPSFTRLSIEELDLSRFDLAPPAVTLRENGQEFFFGDTNPLEGRRYVMVGAVVHLIRDDLYPQLLQEPVFFISPRLLPEGVPLREIDLPGHRLNFVNNVWKDAEAEDMGKEKLESLVSAWLSATAVSLGKLEPAQSLGEVEITTRNGEIMRFEIRQLKPLLKLARTDLSISYTMPTGAAETLLLK